MDGSLASKTTPTVCSPGELFGVRCQRCGLVSYPVRENCSACGSDQMEMEGLGQYGRLWTWTVQRFMPKSPPYQTLDLPFVPFAVGYVELAGGVRVEGLLRGAVDFDYRIGMSMEVAMASDPKDPAPFYFVPARTIA